MSVPAVDVPANELAPVTYPAPPVLPTSTGVAPVATGLQMKQRNPIAVWLGLPLIMFGIYYYVWLYKIHSELGMFDRRRIVGATGPVLAWLFGIVTLFIWPLVSTYNTGKTIAAAQRSAGLVATCSGGIGVLLVFVIGLQSLYYQVQLNKIVAANPTAPEGTQVPLYV